MIIRKGYRYLLKPTAEQAEQFLRFAGCSRLVWNESVELQKAYIERTQKPLNYAQLCSHLKLLKEKFAFLKEAHSQPLQQKMKDLSQAVDQFLDGKKGCPKFKKRGQHDSFRFPLGTKVSV